MNTQEMKQALDEAKRTMRAADYCADMMARMLVGRLQSGNVSHYYLRRLKKELKNYNMHTGEWND